MTEWHRNQPFRLRHWVLVACFCSVAAWGQRPPKGQVIDRAVASIEGQVITLSQLEFEARVLLVNAGAAAAAFAPLDHDALKASLNAIIDERLATLEADKLEAYPVEAEEVQKAIADFRARFESEAKFKEFLARNEADLQDVGRVLERSLRARRALEGKLRLRVQVTAEDVAAAKAVSPELKDVTDAMVKQRLVNERFQKLVKQELEAARRDVDVRLLGPFSPKSGAGP
ncbi:MAG: hypothetical protein IT380_09835 [Myxococcales bacterium]|nr:hypothetical protein [Myxococcales bacterium]